MGKKQVNLRLDLELIDSYERLAKENDRDRTYFMVKALKDFFSNSQLIAQAKPKENPVGKRFIPPTVSEVVRYFIEAGLDEVPASLQGENFVNFYESKGWVVGKTKMQLWRSAAANWLNRYRDQHKSVGTRGMTLERELSDTSWARGEI